MNHANKSSRVPVGHGVINLGLYSELLSNDELDTDVDQRICIHVISCRLVVKLIYN